MWNLAFTALLGPAVVLVGVLASELRSISAVETDSIPTPPPLQLPSRPVARASRVPTDRLVAAVLARPLFSASRRPAAAPALSAAPPAVLPRLTGVIVQGSERSGIFVLAGGGKPMVAHEGGAVGGYTVQAIQAGRVTLSGPDGVHVLRPTFNPQARAVGTPALPPDAAGPDAPSIQSLRGLPGFAGLPASPQASSAR